MRVFVTGGTGFIGSHLVRRLVERGDDVVLLCRPTSNVAVFCQLPVHIAYGDLRDAASLRKAVAGAQVVYHCAVLRKGSWREHVQGTVEGTRQMLEASLEAGVEKFVYLSSVTVYNASQFPDGALVNEAFPLEEKPASRGYYSRAKVDAEKVVLQFLKEASLPICIIRPGTVYGPRGKLFYPDVGYFLKGKLLLVLGNGFKLVPLVYVENLVDAIVLAAYRDSSIGQIYNVVDPAPPTQRDYLSKYKSLTGIRAPILFVPLPLLNAVAFIAERTLLHVLSEVPTMPTTHYLNCITRNLRYDTAKVEKDLGWVSRVSLDEGLRRTLFAHADVYEKQGLTNMNAISGQAGNCLHREQGKIPSVILGFVEKPGDLEGLGNEEREMVEYYYKQAEILTKRQDVLLRSYPKVLDWGYKTIEEIRDQERARRIHLVIRRFLRTNSPKCLDLGCFVGHVSLGLPRYGYSVIGIDVRDEAIEVARFGQKAFNVQNVEFLLLAPEDISKKLDSNSFDVVIMDDVIEHLKEPQLVLDNVYEILKPGGCLYISAANRLFPYDPHSRTWVKSWFIANLFTWNGLKNALEKRNFEVHNMTPYIVRHLGEVFETKGHHSAVKFIVYKWASLPLKYIPDTLCEYLVNLFSEVLFAVAIKRPQARK